MKDRVAVLGAGAWGTVVARHCVENGSPTSLWARRSELARAINTRHVNVDHLPGIGLPPSLHATADLEDAVSGASTILVAIPSRAFRRPMIEVGPMIDPNATVVSLTKGIEADSLLRMTQVIADAGGVPAGRVAALSGPNLAGEVARGQPTATVVACSDIARAKKVQQLFHHRSFFCFANDDVVGVEIGGACKNVIALAAGMSDGLGFGDNSKSALITRGLAEIARLGVVLGAQLQTFLGLAGMGDLVATCMSTLSRNHRVGCEIGKGRSLDQIEAEMNEVAEGVSSCRPILALARRAGVKMPIAWRVEKILFEGARPEDMLMDMMIRAPEAEFRDITAGSIRRAG
ncbi:MAG: NAD(P)H-dependent glycerol-3-phosphate dehydrogenase [Actinomycetota bacterium]